MKSIFSPFAIVNQAKYPMIANTDDFMKTYSDYVSDIVKDSIGSIAKDFGGIFEAQSILTGIQHLKNKDGTLLVSVDVPGIKEADLGIEIKGNLVSILGKRKTANSESSISKTFSIPEGYSADNIKAELADGVLTLTLQPLQIKEEQSKKIQVITKAK